MEMYLLIVLSSPLLLFTEIEFSLGDRSPYTSNKYEWIYINETTQKHNKYKYTLPKHNCQNTHTLQNTHTHTHIAEQV
jgi:hypothetical protein